MIIPLLAGDSLIEEIPKIVEVMEGEEWRIIPLNDNYAVSNFGRVIRGSYNTFYVRQGKEANAQYSTKLLRSCKDSYGYPVVGIFINEEIKSMHVHRLVALTFIPNPEGKPTVNHIDGNKENNNVDNLEWATWSENNSHAISTGLRTSVVPVKCLETGVIFESIADAGNQMGIVSETIRESIINKYTVDEGYTFIKLDGSVEDEKEYHKKLYNKYLWRKDTGKAVPVLCLDNGMEFDSWAAAARWLHVDSAAIQYAVDNKSVCKGHVFATKDQIVLDKQRYIDYCYTRSKFFKHLASKPTFSLYDRAIVLNSGGMDSTTCLSIAIKELGVENVSTVSVFYQQKHSKELVQAKKIADSFGVSHYELDLSFLYKYSNCSLLTNSTEDIVDKSYSDQIKENEGGKVSTYVPFRNGVLLSMVAALAQSLYENELVAIYIGAHADDAAGEAYADCSPRFMKHMAKAIAIGTYNKVGLESPLVNLTKADVCKIGLELNTPYELTTSCYHGRDKACAKCGTCRDRIAAFRANGVPDPIEYEGEDPFADMRGNN